jgi:hypothetical protein
MKVETHNNIYTTEASLKYSNPSVYEQSVYEFSLIRINAEINTCFSIYEPIFGFRAPSSHKPIVVPGASYREVIGN